MHDDETKREEQQKEVEGEHLYQTPKLRRLGKVEHLTQGALAANVPDASGVSF